MCVSELKTWESKEITRRRDGIGSDKEKGKKENKELSDDEIWVSASESESESNVNLRKVYHEKACLLERASKI